MGKTLTKQDKALKILGYVILALCVAFTLFVIIGRWIGAVSSLLIYQTFDIFSPNQAFNPWLRSISYVVCVLTISYGIRFVLGSCFNWVKRGKAIVSLLCSFIKYIAVVVVIFFILAVFGVDTKSLVAGIGILSLIVGLAIQPLLQDIIAGIFTVFEKTYDVGDVVVIDNFRGTVTEIGIRTTKLRDAGGDVKVINNSDIRTLVNMTSELSWAISDIDIEYGESLERVEGIINANLDKIKENIPSIVSGPFYKGVSALGASGVTLRLVAECLEDKKFQTQRDMNRQLKLLFDANGINIPFTQVVVHTAPESKPIK